MGDSEKDSNFNKPLEDLKKLVSKLKEETKKPRKKVKFRVFDLKRDTQGNRTYPTRGKSRKKSRSVQNHSVKTITSEQSNTPERNNESASITELSSFNENDWYNDDVDYGATLIQSLQSISDSLKTKAFFKRKRKTWSERMEVNESQWHEMRDEVLSADIMLHHISSPCSKCNEKAIICCVDCRDRYFCSDCDEVIHSQYPFHNRSAELDGSLLNLLPSEFISQDQVAEKVAFVPIVSKNCKMCGVRDWRKIQATDICVVICLSGRFDLNQYLLSCNNCGGVHDPFNLNDILESGFWPSLPNKFSVLFKTEVFDRWDAFRKHMPGSSEKSFLDSLSDMTLSFGRHGKIVPSTFSTAFREWCLLKHMKDQIKQAKWMDCPSCSIAQHSCHVDGNCKLYRYKSSGRRRRESYYESCFIADDKDKDAYLDSIYKKKPSAKEENDVDISCGGNWSAARNKMKKKKSVDITGLEVASCRHQLAQKATNMTQGELYGYPMYLIKKFIVPYGVEFIFADVMCKLSKFIQKNDPDLRRSFKGALSVMHAKGHSLDCQVTWDGQWILGTGRSTGEECEQLFSYLSRASNTTKYQRPENREETLTELAMFWNKRKIINFSKSLHKRHERVSSDLIKSKLDINKLIKQHNITNVSWENLVEKFKSMGKRITTNKLPYLTKEQSLILLYVEVRNLPKDFSSTLKTKLEQFSLPDTSQIRIPILKRTMEEKESLLKDIWKGCVSSDLNIAYSALIQSYLKPAFQIAIEELYFEVVHWSSRIRKYADTSKQRMYFRKKMSCSSNKLKHIVRSFKLFFNTSQSVDDLMSGNFDWTRELPNTSINVSDFDERLLVELHLKKTRCEEEIDLLKRDMQSYLTFYLEKVNKLKLEVSKLEEENFFEDSENKKLNLGKISLLKEGLLFAEYQLACGIETFRGVIQPMIPTELNDESSSLKNVTCFDTEDTSPSAPNPTLNVLSESDSEDEVVTEISVNNLLIVGNDLISMLTVDLFEVMQIDTLKELSLPITLCQSEINGRNGSNACTVISLLIGYGMTVASRIGKLDVSANGFDNIATLFVGCMEIGNLLHDGPEMLTVSESLDIVPSETALSIVNERNSFLFGERDLTLKTVVETFLNNNGNYMVITVKLISVCLYASGDQIFIFDSHCRGERGASIFLCDRINLQHALETVFNVAPDEMIYSCELKTNDSTMEDET